MANFDDLLNNSPVEKSGAPQINKEEYAAKKKAEREEMFGLSDDVAMQIADDSGAFQQYLDVQGRFDRYSAVNALLIYAQQELLPNKEANRIGSFDYWKNQNCSVKPGQTAISILEPHEYTKEDGSPGTGYNVKKVFDISQVNTRKLRTPPVPKHSERQLLQALVSSADVAIKGVDELPNNLCAMADPTTGEISVRKGLDFPRTFSALAQCIAANHMNDKSDSQLIPSFSECCVSYMICKKHGVDTQSFRFDDAPDVFDGMDAQAVKGELSGIRDAAESISGRMARQFEVQQKAAKNNESR